MVKKVNTKDDIFERIPAARKRLALLGVRSIGLFGSFVRGEQTSLNLLSAKKLPFRITAMMNWLMTLYPSGILLKALNRELWLKIIRIIQKVHAFYCCNKIPTENQFILYGESPRVLSHQLSL